MKDTILEVKDLSVTFTQYDRGFSRRTLHAVEKMDLSVRAGEIVAVVGSSGSGKSLLALQQRDGRGDPVSWNTADGGTGKKAPWT